MEILFSKRRIGNNRIQPNEFWYALCLYIIIFFKSSEGDKEDNVTNELFRKRKRRTILINISFQAFSFENLSISLQQGSDHFHRFCLRSHTLWGRGCASTFWYLVDMYKLQSMPYCVLSWVTYIAISITFSLDWILTQTINFLRPPYINIHWQLSRVMQN